MMAAEETSHASSARSVGSAHSSRSLASATSLASSGRGSLQRSGSLAAPKDSQSDSYGVPVELSFGSAKLGFSLELRRDKNDDARLVVTAVKDSCEHGFSLTAGFEQGSKRVRNSHLSRLRIFGSGSHSVSELICWDE